MNGIKGFLSASLSSATFGLIPLFTLPLMQGGMGFNSILLYRFSASAVLMAAILLLCKGSFKITKGEFFTMSSLSLFYLGSAYFLFWSYKYLASGTATTIQFLYPVFVTAVMALWFKEKLSLSVVCAIVLATIGVAVLSAGQGYGAGSFAGIILALLSAVFYAVYIVGIQKSGVSKMPSLKVTFYMLFFGAVVLWGGVLLVGGPQPVKGFKDISNILLLALVPTIISNAALVYALKNIGSIITSVLGALEPLTAVFVGVLVFKEAFTPNLFSGIILIIAAVTLVVLSGRMDRHIKTVFNKALGHLGINFE